MDLLRSSARALILFVAALSLVLPMYAVDEDDLRAAFMLNFARFTRWPASASHGPLVIAVLNNHALADALDRVVGQRLVQNRPVSIRRYRAVHEIDACHILFVGLSEQRRLKTIFAQTKAQPVLLVSDAPEFTDMGGGVGFLSVNGRMTFTINLRQVRAAGLDMEAPLLQVAFRAGSS